MSNFNLRPIPKEIRYKLLQKQKAFSRQSIGKASSANEPIELGDDFLNFYNRATWAHMIGLTVIKRDKKDRIAIIGAGELNQEPGNPEGVANEPLDLMKSSFDSIYSNTLYRPISGIKSISTRYEGTLKSRRECTVNFTVFSLEDLDRLSPYFFRVGSEVLVEFGWNVGTDTASSMFNTSLGHKIIDIYHNKGVKGIKSDGGVIDLLKDNTAKNYEEEILKHNGDYEYVLGQISNFEYSLRSDGGFDCVVKVQTVGMSLLDTKVDREYSPSVISAGDRENEESKIEFTSPDDVSDEFFQMMHNLPEIVYGSLIQGYGDTHNKKPPDPDKDKKPTPTKSTPNNGINTIAAAWYLMGGSSPSDHFLHKETQQFALIWLTWAAGLTTQQHWTKNKSLVSVYQEALMEQGHDLPAFGPDGSMIRKDGSMSETQKAGMDFFNKFNKGGVEYPEDFIKVTKQDFSIGPDSGKKAMAKYFRQVPEGDIDFWFTRMDKIRKDIHNKDTFKSNVKVTEDSIEFLSTGTSLTDSRRKKYNNVSPKYLTSQEDSVSNVEELDIPLSIESKFYIPMASGKSVTEVDSGASGAPESYESVKNMTIFTTYKQKDIIQIFTGFNWGKSKKDFDTLSQIYAKETYRDNLIPIGKARAEAKVASETYGFGVLSEESAKNAGWDMYGRIVNDIMSKFGVHPAWQSLAEDEDNRYLSTADAAANLESGTGPTDASDEFLEFVDPSGKVPPKIWIRWGWFEDNILTRYLGYMTDVDAGGAPISLFKSVEPKINLKGEIIAGYESNKIGLPGPLLTTDVNQIIIPDRIETLENTKEPTVEGNFHNFYASLGKFLQGEVGTSIPNVEIAAQPKDETSESSPGKDGQTEKYKVGYLRNLYVEATTLQEAFLNIGTLKEGLDRFISIMYNNFGKIHQLEVQQGRDDNMIGIVDTNLIYDKAIWKTDRDKQISSNLKDEANQINVFEFPAWEKESIVKSQDLKVTIPSEMALTALYSGNEHIRNFGIYDESRGSVEAQKLSKFLRLDDKGKDIAGESVSNNNQGLTPIVTSKNLTVSGDGENEVGKHKYNYKDSFLPLLNAELKRSLGKNPINATPIKLSEEEDANKRKSQNTAHNIDIAYMKGRSRLKGYYNNKGTLEENNPYNMRRIMEYELQYTEKGAVQNNYPTINGLLDLSLTIDGTAGIFPGNSYISKYLPKAWQARITGQGPGEYPVLFQTTDVAHEISSDGWSTTLTGMPRMNSNAFPYKYAKIEDNDRNQDPFIPRTAGKAISEYYNFFNLNYEFANQCLPSIRVNSPILEGINTDVSFSIGSFKAMGMVQAFNQLTYLGGEKSAMRGGDMQFEDGRANLYADFSTVLEKLNFEENKIPGKESGQTAPKESWKDIALQALGKDKIWFIQDKAFTITESDFISNVELLLFLQMSMIISGLTYYGLGNESIDKAFYNNMLADNNFESFRPSLLRKVGDDTLSRLISKSEIGEDKSPASEVYFSTVPHGEIDLNLQQKNSTNFTIDGYETSFYYYEPITPFIWQKKEHFSEDKENKDEVSNKVWLIGPSRFTPEGSRLLPHTVWQRGGDIPEYPATEDLKLLENVFMTILRNEYGIGSWSKFDTLIAKSLGSAELYISSEKVFEYALDCEYRIKKP